MRSPQSRPFHIPHWKWSRHFLRATESRLSNSLSRFYIHTGASTLLIAADAKQNLQAFSRMLDRQGPQKVIHMRKQVAGVTRRNNEAPWLLPRPKGSAQLSGVVQPIPWLPVHAI